MGPDAEHPTGALAARRAELFRETPAEMVGRWALGTAWALKTRERALGLPALGAMWLKYLAGGPAGLPDPRAALARPEGLAGIAGDLSPETLIEAHRRGLYPWAHFGPLKWWSPAERCVLKFPDYHMSKRLRSHIRQDRYRITFDRDFEGVIKACAGPRSGKWRVTWITPRIMRAYAGLYDAGHVHSFEVWNRDGELAGGGYGVAAGRVFTIESQFSREPNTSKMGFSVLAWHLAAWGFALADAKAPTPTVVDMGFRNIPRDEFLDCLREVADAPGPAGRWQAEADLAKVAAWQPAAQESRTLLETAAA